MFALRCFRTQNVDISSSFLSPCLDPGERIAETTCRCVSAMCGEQTAVSRCLKCDIECLMFHNSLWIIRKVSVSSTGFIVLSCKFWRELWKESFPPIKQGFFFQIFHQNKGRRALWSWVRQVNFQEGTPYLRTPLHLAAPWRGVRYWTGELFFVRTLGVCCNYEYMYIYRLLVCYWFGFPIWELGTEVLHFFEGS